MKRYFGTPLRGLYSHLPTICAQVRENHRVPPWYFPRGAMVALVRPDLTDAETCQCYAKSVTGKWRAVELPWWLLQFIEIRKIRSDVGERCWRASAEEMERLAAFLKDAYEPKVQGFAPEVDDA